MSNTYTQINLQFVFAVKYRAALISSTWKDDLYRYITAIVQNNRHKMLQINGMPDHIHILIGMRPHQSVSDLMREVKSDSCKWIRSKGLSPSFAWQEGYGAFAYSQSHVDDVVRYIQNQEIHHRQETFLEEYRRFLDLFKVGWDEKYIFTDLQ